MWCRNQQYVIIYSYILICIDEELVIPDNTSSATNQPPPPAPSSQPTLAQSSTIPKPIQQEAPKPEVPKSNAIPLRHNYYQTTEHMVVSLLGIKGIPQENFTINIDSTSIHIVVKPIEGSGYEPYKWDVKLFEPIKEEEVNITYLPSKIEMKLVKKNPMMWPKLEESDPVIPAVRPPVADTSKPKYPSSYASKRDWESIEKEIKKEEEEEKPEGEEGLNKFFQQLYRNANEDTRRAMMKSFQTSGGTVLSTNWNEVKDKNYEKEISPPSGMQWVKE